MKVYYISDIHLEFRQQNKALKHWTRLLDVTSEAESVLVIAGDLGYCLNNKGTVSNMYKEALTVAKKKFSSVILVLGNHDYWVNRDIEQVDSLMTEMCRDIGVYYLQASSVTIDRTRFIGCTLWSDISDTDFTSMNDRHYIQNFRAWTMAALHHQHVCYLNKTIGEVGEWDNTVVVTHHLPTFQVSIDEHTGYASNLEWLLQEHANKISLWICGHTHNRCDKTVENVRICINPVGYPGENSSTTLQCLQLI